MNSDQKVAKIKEIVGNGAHGNRYLVVLQRGWIFAGDLRLDAPDGWMRLTNVKNVRKWTQNGFGGLALSAKGAAAELDDCADIQFDLSAVVFIVPISGDWDA